MMKAIRSAAVCLLLLFSMQAFSQDFEVPGDYSFEKKEDYARYEKDIIAASKWLFANPLDKQTFKRKGVAKFVAEWVLGSPTVEVELNEVIMDFEKKNPGMMVLFMAGCSQYVLENNYSKDVLAKHRFALQAMINYYKGDNGVNKDKKLDKLVKQAEAGKLDEWIEEYFPIKK
jgi:hypothetical protein